jgi:hypothetical protein
MMTYVNGRWRNTEVEYGYTGSFGLPRKNPSSIKIKRKPFIAWKTAMANSKYSMTLNGGDAKSAINCAHASSPRMRFAVSMICSTM